TEGFDGDIARLVISQASPGTSNGVTEYAVPPASCLPSCQTHISGIGIDGNGAVWFDDADSARIGSFMPGSGTFTMYNVDSGDQFQLNAHPHDGLAIDHGGNVWFTEEFARK